MEEYMMAVMDALYANGADDEQVDNIMDVKFDEISQAMGSGIPAEQFAQQLL